MKKKLIIFDLDGVLVDSTKLVSDYHTLLKPSITEKILNEMLCGNYHEEIGKHEAVYGVIEESREQEAKFQLEKAQSPVFEGMTELLMDLYKCGYVLAINTSSYYHSCAPGLERAGILKYFDVIATADVSRSKVEKFKILEEKFKLPKEDIIFVTDTLGDVREADISGIPTIAVTYGAHDRTYFEREKHRNLKAVVDSVEELYNLITSL